MLYIHYQAYQLYQVINYVTNSVGVAEHPNIIESIDLLVDKLANAEDKLRTLEDWYKKIGEGK